MTEARNNFTDAPARRDDGTTEQPSRAKWLLYLGGAFLGIAFLAVLVAGLVVLSINKARHAAERSQSANNLKQMVLALNNIASNTVNGDIPPAYGTFPAGSEQSASFFEYLWPYIEQGGLYRSQQLDFPIKTYIAPVDSRNRGTDGTISYCSNATALSGRPRLPLSFNGRTTSIICVMERSGLDGAHKWSNQNNYLGAPGQPPPFPQIGVDPSVYLDGAPQGFLRVGCLVGLADGSVRLVTKSQSDSWSWACDPAIASPQPSNW